MPVFDEQSLLALVADPRFERALVEGSHVYGDGADFRGWEAGRRFIADLITVRDAYTRAHTSE